MLVTADQLGTLRGKVALVDGAFDPLHLGHLAYFHQARATVSAPLFCAVAAETKGRPTFLPAAHRAQLVDALDVITYAHVKTQPTEGLLDQLRPTHYLKGRDWCGRLPDAQLEVCRRLGIPIVYLDTVCDSSTARLAAWARQDEAQHVEALERLVQTQKPATTPWTPVTDYSFEARTVIEGCHPQLIRDVLQPTRVLDVGCGPGHLVRLLQALGVEARGVDKSDLDLGSPLLLDGQPLLPPMDVVICREVLEHLTLLELRRAVTNLCALSTKFVYVTTRFAQSPAHLLSVDTSDDLDPTHSTMLNQNFLRTLFILEGCTRRADLEARMDWKHLGRVLVYQVPA